MSVWEAYTRLPGRRRTGALDVLDGSSFTVRHNAVGAYTLNVPWSDDAWDRLQPGAAVEIRRCGRYVCSGPVVWVGWDDRFDESTGAHESVITVEGVTAEVFLADRITLPNPASPPDQQAVSAHWARVNMPTETIMCELVSEQLGPAALPMRRVPGLVVAGSQGRGLVRGTSSRFGVVLGHLQGLAASSGLGFRVAPTTDGWRFEVFEPNNRAGAVRYSTSLGNVAGQSYGMGAPGMTSALVGGGGEGTARLLVDHEATSPSYLEWSRRIEAFVDARDTEDTAELAERAIDSVVEAAAERSFSFTPIDVPGMDLLGGVNLGDRVTVYAGPRASSRRLAFSDLVREIHGEIAGDTDVLSCAVGSEGATTGIPLPSTALLMKLAARLRALEGSA